MLGDAGLDLFGPMSDRRGEGAVLVAPIGSEQPATSAARMAASLRSTRCSAMKPFPPMCRPFKV
jgi:hypothetical protein